MEEIYVVRVLVRILDDNFEINSYNAIVTKDYEKALGVFNKEIAEASDEYGQFTIEESNKEKFASNINEEGNGQEISLECWEV